MTVASKKFDDLENFPISSYGSGDAQAFYSAYLKSKELVAKLPKGKAFITNDETLYTIFREVQSSQAFGGALFRRKADATEALSTIWVSRIRQIAKVFITTSESFPFFSGLDQNFLSEFAKLSSNAKNLPLLGDILQKKGIALVFERSMPGMKVDGAVFRLGTGNPVIGLSLRYPRLDIFWFTLSKCIKILHFSCLFTQMRC